MSAFRPGSNRSVHGFDRSRMASEIIMRGQRPERQAVAGVASRRVLMVGASPDVRQAIGRLDDLAGPAMRQLDARNDRRQTLFEAPIAGLRVVLLAGLVILAAEDHDVEVPVRLDAQVVVRIVGIPPQRVGHLAFRHPSGDHVAGVQREFRLKERGAGEPAEADQRIVRGDDDVFATHRVAS